jgi:alkylation response protein AidB-like acyl-CoA dehydrogenase
LTYVEAVGVADSFLVTARTGDGLSQILVPATSVSGVSMARGRSIDMTRRFGSVTFERARLPLSAVLGEPGHAAAAVQRQLLLAVTLQCAEMVGVADRTLELTLTYGRDRMAFGRPILSFQALKHRIADLWIWLEGSKAVSEHLAAAVDEPGDDVATLASVAKAYVGEHCVDIVDECVQISGGIAVTWEYDIHLYSRRAVVDQVTFGTPEEHKRQLLELLRGQG